MEENKISTQTLLFRNEGIVRGEVNFLSNDIQKLRIEPNYLSLEPEDSKEVEFRLFVKDLGILKELISLDIKGHSIYKGIEMSANVIQNKQFISDDIGEKIEKIDFGKLILGKKKIKNV